MEKSRNDFLQVNSKRISALMQKIEEERFKSSYQGQIDFTQLLFMFKGMIGEIERLQRGLDTPKESK